jgi:hypothetical protein
MPKGLTPLDEAILQGRLWTPAVLRERGLLQGWYDASDLSTITLATGVSAWADKSARGRHALQATAASQPAFSPNGGPFGRGVIQPGSASRMAAAVAAGAFSGGMNVFAAWQKTGASVGANANAFPFVRAASNQPSPLDAWDTTRFIGNGSTLASAGTYTNLSVAMTAFVQMRLRLRTTFTFHEFLNAVQVSTHTGTSYGDNATEFSFFSRPDLATHMIGSVGEIILTGDIEDWIVCELEGYLAWRWTGPDKLPVTHPFRMQPPLLGN